MNRRSLLKSLAAVAAPVVFWPSKVFDALSVSRPRLAYPQGIIVTKEAEAPHEKLAKKAAEILYMALKRSGYYGRVFLDENVVQRGDTYKPFDNTDDVVVMDRHLYTAYLSPEHLQVIGHYPDRPSGPDMIDVEEDIKPIVDQVLADVRRCRYLLFGTLGSIPKGLGAHADIAVVGRCPIRVVTSFAQRAMGIVISYDIIYGLIDGEGVEPAKEIDAGYCKLGDGAMVVNERLPKMHECGCDASNAGKCCRGAKKPRDLVKEAQLQKRERERHKAWS